MRKSVLTKAMNVCSGCVNFVRRFRQLERNGYTGPYMIEMWYAEGTDEMREIAKAKAWMELQFSAAMEDATCWNN